MLPIRQYHYAFVHGGIQGGWVWDTMLAALCRQTGGKVGRALALDVPGCGTKRMRATGELTLDDVAAELVDEIERAELREVVVVGRLRVSRRMYLDAGHQVMITRPHALAEALLHEASAD
jgi:hypothetical protein